MTYQLNIREEEVKNRLRKDYFNAFNAEEVLEKKNTTHILDI